MKSGRRVWNDRNAPSTGRDAAPARMPVEKNAVFLGTEGDFGTCSVGTKVDCGIVANTDTDLKDKVKEK